MSRIGQNCLKVIFLIIKYDKWRHYDKGCKAKYSNTPEENVRNNCQGETEYREAQSNHCDDTERQLVVFIYRLCLSIEVL